MFNPLRYSVLKDPVIGMALTPHNADCRLGLRVQRGLIVTTPATFLTEDMRLQTIGLEGQPTTTEIEKGAIIKFAQAIGDDNPFFNDEESARDSRFGGIIAPPTFLRSVDTSRPELPYEFPFNRRLDGGSDWEYFAPIRAGDRITAVSRIDDINERTGRLGLMIIMSTTTTYRNQFDQIVATQTGTGISY